MAVKMNLRIITRNHAADPEIGFLAKSISKSIGGATAMPTAWELIFFNSPNYTCKRKHRSASRGNGSNVHPQTSYCFSQET